MEKLDFTKDMPKYVIILGEDEQTLGWFDGCKTLRKISDNEYIISVEEFNDSIEDYRASSAPDPDYS